MEHKYHLDHMEMEISHKEIKIKEEIQKNVKEERINDCEILDETLSSLNIRNVFSHLKGDTIE